MAIKRKIFLTWALKEKYFEHGLKKEKKYFAHVSSIQTQL